MLVNDIKNFSEVRYNLRAYLSYLFDRNIPNNSLAVSLDVIKKGFDKIAHEIERFDAFYVLGPNGVQLEDSFSLASNKIPAGGKGENRSQKAYYYRAVKENRCVLSDPYPSSLTNELCVTASKPIYDDNGKLKFVICVDMSLNDAIKLISPDHVALSFHKFTKSVYTFFALALFCVVCVLAWLSVKTFWQGFNNINISEMFETTILLTLALAIFDLVKAIFEEEVLGRLKSEKSGISRTMVRFIASIIIALAIEALMLVFKFAITSPREIVFAVYLIAGVAMLLVSLSIYLFATYRKKINF